MSDPYVKSQGSPGGMLSMDSSSEASRTSSASGSNGPSNRTCAPAVAIVPRDPTDRRNTASLIRRTSTGSRIEHRFRRALAGSRCSGTERRDGLGKPHLLP